MLHIAAIRAHATRLTGPRELPIKVNRSYTRSLRLHTGARAAFRPD
jgi:hypothetical protein